MRKKHVFIGIENFFGQFVLEMQLNNSNKASITCIDQKIECFLKFHAKQKRSKIRVFYGRKFQERKSCNNL